MLNIINLLRSMFTETRTKEIIGEVQEAGVRDADLLCDAYFQGFRSRMEERAAEMQNRFLSLNFVVPESFQSEREDDVAMVYDHDGVAFPANINEQNWRDYRGTIDIEKLTWAYLRKLASVVGVMNSKYKRPQIERALKRKGF